MLDFHRLTGFYEKNPRFPSASCFASPRAAASMKDHFIKIQNYNFLIFHLAFPMEGYSSLVLPQYCDMAADRKDLWIFCFWISIHACQLIVSWAVNQGPCTAIHRNTWLRRIRMHLLFPKHFGVMNFVIYLRFVFWKGSTTSKDVHAMISWNLQISSVWCFF